MWEWSVRSDLFGSGGAVGISLCTKIGGAVGIGGGGAVGIGFP